MMSKHNSSFTSSLSILQQDKYPRSSFTKRPYSYQNHREGSPKPDHDTFLRGKRRRRDNLTVAALDRTPGLFSFSRQGESKLKSKQNPRFPSTSSEFGLSSTTSTSHRTMWRTKNTESKGRREAKNETLPDLVHLRSSAFWELHQSVIENGEGFVRRMRDYERSRSKNYQKAKEAEKRGRKFASQRRKVYVSASDESDEDEILIFSGDSNHIQWESFLGKRSQSRDTMDVDEQPISWSPSFHAENHDPCPSSEYLSNSEFVQSVSEVKKLSSLNGGTYPDEPFADPPKDPTPSPSHSIHKSSNSSHLSLALPPSSPEPNTSLPSSGTEKALAELTLALSNGAGSVTDYSAIWNYQKQFNTENDYDHGEVWH